MKKIIHEEDSQTIMVDKLHENCLIMAKKDGKWSGMIVNEQGLSKSESGFIHRISAKCGACGHFDTLKSCIMQSESCGYEFFLI